MKKIMIICLLLLSVSCKAQKVEPIKNEALDLTVMYVENGIAGLYNAVYGKTFKGAANGLTSEDVEREYTFIVERTDCQRCKVINVIILNYSVTPLQADKDVKKMKREYFTASMKK